ncbi:hypothetical protein EC991_002556 [Linnemannia zychae]|nr:hypothetical protein EC991_002556 [Linnemannia zychae]
MGVSSTTATTTIRTTTAADASDNDGEVTESHFIFNNSNTTPASPLDYCSHIRHINLEPCFIEVAFPKLHERVLHDSILEYVASKEFDDIFLTQPLSTRYGRLGLNEPGILYSYYLSILQHEVTWCLAFPILEQLQSLTIHHTYSVGQFMKVIGRLESLEEVRFMLIDTHEYIFKDPDWDRWNRYSEEAAWKMVEFVRQHAQEFKGLLKTVHCFNTPYRYDDWGWVGAVKQEIHRILPPLSRPTRLEKDNWERIVAHRNTTDLGHVWEVDGEGMPRLWYDAVCEDNRPILQRCRALKTVKLELFRGGKSPFRWAVEEKVEVEELAETDRSLHGGQEVASQATQRTHGLIKLENVDIISSADHERIEAIDDIVFAFNQTF